MKTQLKRLLTLTVIFLTIFSFKLIIFSQSPQTKEEKLATAEKVFMEGFALFNEGTAESLRAAIPKIEMASELFRQAGDNQWFSASLIALGRIANDLGDKPVAIERYKKALPIFRKQGEKLGELGALNNIGAAYFALGENKLALEFFNQALTLNRELDDKEEEARLLSNIGNVYTTLGDKQTAFKYYEQSLSITRLLGNKSQESNTLNDMGVAYTILGDKQTALNYYNQAKSIAEIIDDKRIKATILNNTAVTYSDLENHKKAIEINNEVLALRRISGDREGEAVSLHNIGTEYLLIGEAENALQNLNQALLIRKEIRDLSGEAITLKHIMIGWRIIGNLRLATFYGKQSINKYQLLRLNIRGLNIELQRSYLNSVEDTYRQLSSLLIAQKRLPELLQILNLFKDQQFFDFDQIIRKQSFSLSLTSREQAFANEYERSVGRIEATGKKSKELWQKTDAKQPISEEYKRELENEMKSASDEFFTVLKGADTEFAKISNKSDETVEVPDIQDMQTALRELTRQTGQKAVAIYQVADGNQFHTLIITPDKIESTSVKINAEIIINKSKQFWALLQSDAYDPLPLSNELYNTLFKATEDKLPKDTKTIMWSLDGSFRYIPMAALFDGKHYLVEKYNHVIFTRADKERITRSVNPNWSGYGFTVSKSHKVKILDNIIEFNPLEYAKEEMEIFRTENNPKGLIDGEVFPEAEFNKESLINALKQKRPLIHISSHFSFYPGDTSRSFLLLGDGTAFTLSEMKNQENLFQGVDLLTLSACETATQLPDANGREIDGFAELAQRLGAGSVISTLWKVRDRSTSQLIKNFYENRQKRKLNKAEALQKAQLDLLFGRNNQSVKSLNNQNTEINRSSESFENISIEKKYRVAFKADKLNPFAHPYYWSPFVLFGNWK